MTWFSQRKLLKFFTNSRANDDLSIVQFPALIAVWINLETEINQFWPIPLIWAVPTKSHLLYSSNKIELTKNLPSGQAKSPRHFAFFPN